MGVMNASILSIGKSTIGKKVIMAITGLIWVGYVVAHMYGNLKIFAGEAALNEYAEGLRTLGSPILGYEQFLWIARIVLIASFALHVWAAYSLKARNNASRSKGYAVQTYQRANYANRSMIWGGTAILLFVIYHIAHLTLGWAHGNFEYGEVYANMIYSFRNPIVVGVYLLAIIALAFHLYHGTWSVFQTLGLNNKNYTMMFRILSIVLAVVVPIGFAVVPLGVLFGIVG